MSIARSGATYSNGTISAQTSLTRTGVASPADADVLIVCVGVGKSLLGGTPSVNSVVWNSGNLTRVQTQQRPNQAKAELWGLVSPAQSTSASLVTAVAQSAAIAHIAYFLRDSDGSFTNKGGANANNNAPTVTINSTLTDLVLDSMCWASSVTATAAHTLIATQGGSGHNTIRLHAQEAAGASPTRTMNWSTASSKQWAISAASFIDVGAGTYTLPLLGVGL